MALGSHVLNRGAESCSALRRGRTCAPAPLHASLHHSSKPCSTSHQQQRIVLDAAAAPWRLQTACRRPQVLAQASIDPLSLTQTTYKTGRTFIIHGAAELDQFTQQEAGKSKLTVLMAKSSHCRPCKKFAATYHAFAAQYADCQFLEIVGDESKETRKMMVEMKVKVTPSFFLYRDGKLLNTLTGTKQQQLRTAITQHLKPGEACTPDLNTSSEEEEEDSDDD